MYFSSRVRERSKSATKLYALKAVGNEFVAHVMEEGEITYVEPPALLKDGRCRRCSDGGASDKPQKPRDSGFPIRD